MSTSFVIQSSTILDIHSLETTEEAPQSAVASYAPSTYAEPDPEAFEDEDAEALAAYAEECAQWEELEHCAEDIFSLSDLESEQGDETTANVDEAMDMS